MASSYDVFLAYNSSDRAQVQQLYEILRAQELEVFFDEESIPPGGNIQTHLADAIRQSETLVACIGPSGIGPWEKYEVQLAYKRDVEGKIRVIPVALPGVSKIEENEFLILKKVSWIRDFADSKQLKNLLWGITEEKPQTINFPNEVGTATETTTLDEQEPTIPGPSRPTESLAAEDGSQASVARFDDDESRQSIKIMIDDLTKLLKGFNFSFFVGMDAVPPEEECLPSSYRVSKELMTDLGLLDEDRDDLLLPVDLAGDYYVSGKSKHALELALENLLNRHKRKIASPHCRIVQILGAVEAWRQQRRDAGHETVKNPQVVVTTNVDLMLERAFLRSGLAFTRIVQHPDPRTVTITEFRPQIDGKEIKLLPSGASVSKSDIDGLDKLIHDAPHFERGGRLDFDYGQLKRQELARSTGSDRAWDDFQRDWRDSEIPPYAWPLHHLHGPILFKFLGSRDVDDSCVIGRSQLFDLAEGLQPLLAQQSHGNRLPIFKQIKSIVQNTPNLFFGHGYLDPYFLLVCDTLLRKARQENRFLIQQPPRTVDQQRDRRVEALLWKQLGKSMVDRTRVDRLQYDPIDFLRILWKKVKPLNLEKAAP